MLHYILKHKRITLNQQLRHKVTTTKLDAASSAKVQRPTPVLLLRTDDAKEWSSLMQKEFSEMGYFTVDACMTIPKKKESELSLQTCYQELSRATSELSFFPPLLVSYGAIATRISQKFVSNKPVSGLVMIEPSFLESADEKEFPISEFEPRFPLCLLSDHTPPEFLDGWIDHFELKQGRDAVKQIAQWMDDIGM